MAKKPSFRADFGPKNFFVGFTSTRFYTLLQAIIVCYSRKTNEPNLRNCKKTSFGPNFGQFGPGLGRQIFFSKIWLRQSLDVMVSYHYDYHIQYQKKLLIQS